MGSAQGVWEVSRAILSDQDGWVAVLKVFMDESNTHDGASCIAVSAYMARPKTWRAWAKDWNRVKKPIKIFHSVDCANFRGEFEGWDKNRRDPYVAGLLPVIANHPIAGLVVAIQMDDLRAALKGREHLMDLFATPYGACFHWAIATIMQLAVERGNRERIAFVHETNGYKREAFEAFEWVKGHFSRGGTQMTLAFGDKADYVPLQAADVLAYEGAKFLKEPTKESRKAWVALDPEKRKVFARRYGKDNMPYLIDVLERVASQKEQPA